ncbi:hypothetical protein ACHAXS_013629 [Conticribra weissflogii]
MILSSFGPGGYFEEENPPEHPESKILWCDGKQKDHSIDCLDEEPYPALYCTEKKVIEAV